MLNTTHLQPGDLLLFTEWRIGSRYRSGKVGVCPQCGTKGVIYPERTDREGKHWPSHVDHRARFEGWAIFVEEHCTLPLSQGATAGPEVTP